jgi:hypothetical protein
VIRVILFTNENLEARPALEHGLQEVVLRHDRLI